MDFKVFYVPSRGRSKYYKSASTKVVNNISGSGGNVPVQPAPTPSLEGYATEEWVGQQGYLKAPDIEGKLDASTFNGMFRLEGNDVVCNYNLKSVGEITAWSADNPPVTTMAANEPTLEERVTSLENEVAELKKIINELKK